MAKYTVTRSCGHEETVALIGKIKDREWRLENIEASKLCYECYQEDLKRRREEANREAAEVAKEMNLPEKRKKLPLDYMDEEDIIAWICEHEEYECIGDLCIGRGLVGVHATKNGKRFVGTELNHKRLSVLLETMSKNGSSYKKEEIS